MLRTLRATALLALSGLIVLMIAAPDAPARRTVPFGFFGTVFGVSSAISDPVLEQQFTLMARSGVESVRLSVSWAGLERAQGVYDWTASDRLVRVAARRRLQILANVLNTPAWASERPT